MKFDFDLFDKSVKLIGEMIGSVSDLIADPSKMMRECSETPEGMADAARLYVGGAATSLIMFVGIAHETGYVLSPMVLFVAFVQGLIYLVGLSLAASASWRLVGIKHDLRYTIVATMCMMAISMPVTAIMAVLYIVSSAWMWALLAALLVWTWRCWSAFSSRESHTKRGMAIATVAVLALSTIPSQIVSTISVSSPLPPATEPLASRAQD